MKRIIVSILIVLLSFSMQVTVCHYISFGHIEPNLLLITTAAFGFLYGKKAGTLSGFFLGLFADIFTGGIIGFHALLLMYIGYFNGMFKRLLYRDDIKLQLVLVTASDIVYGIVYYLLMFLLRGKFHFTYYLLKIIIPEVVFTLIASVVILGIMSLISRKLSRRSDDRSNAEIV